MIYKYYVLNTEIINSDYIDEERSELELDSAATDWTGEPLAWFHPPLRAGLLALWWVYLELGRVTSGCKII